MESSGKCALTSMPCWYHARIRATANPWRNEFRLGLRLPSLAWIPKPLTSFWKCHLRGLNPRKELQNRCLAKPVFDRGRADGERLTQHQGGNSLGGDAASKCIRKDSSSPWPQSGSFCRRFP